MKIKSDQQGFIITTADSETINRHLDIIIKKMKQKPIDKFDMCIRLNIIRKVLREAKARRTVSITE